MWQTVQDKRKSNEARETGMWNRAAIPLYALLQVVQAEGHAESAFTLGSRKHTLM